MHRCRIAIAAIAGLALSACAAAGGNLRSSGFAPAVRAPALQRAAAAARGQIVWIRKVTVFTKAQMNGDLGLAGQVIAQIGGPPKCDVALYAIKYATIGVHGGPATASEGFFVPLKGCSGPFTLVGYGQGTNVVRAQKITDPTKLNIEPPVLAAIFAAHGYPIAATDYLGLGYSNYPYQPYLVVNAEASAVIDAIRAARAAALRLGVPLSGKLFLTGHSQGGQTALGTQKVIEAANTGEFDLIADAPSSGPYALAQTTLDGLKHPGENAAIYSAYILTAYAKTYGNVYTNPLTVFQNPYARYVSSLLPVNTYAQAAALNGKTLPLKLSRLLQPAFVTRFANDPNIGPRRDLTTNDLLHGWKPVAPVYLCGGSRDPMVEFKNSILAYRYFKGEGASVKLLNVDPVMPPSVPITEYHDAVLVLCHTYERVLVLDAMHGNAVPGRLHDLAPGTIGPFHAPGAPALP